MGVVEIRNTKEWYSHEYGLLISRDSVVVIVAMIDLALRHPEMEESWEEAAIKIGRGFFEKLRDDGYIASEEAVKVFQKTFYGE